MQNIERKIGGFFNERRINGILNIIEPLSYPHVSKPSHLYNRGDFRRTYRNVVTLYSNGDPQVGLLVIECLKDLFMDLVAKGLITQDMRFSPVEVLKSSRDNTPDDQPNLKRLLDEIMLIKREGEDFEATDLSTHSRTIVETKVNSDRDNPFEYDNYDVEHGGISPDVIEIGKTHTHEIKDVTSEETDNYNGSEPHGGWYSVYEHTHHIVGIWGRIVPKSSSSPGRNPKNLKSS